MHRSYFLANKRFRFCARYSHHPKIKHENVIDTFILSLIMNCLLKYQVYTNILSTFEEEDQRCGFTMNEEIANMSFPVIVLYYLAE